MPPAPPVSALPVPAGPEEVLALLDRLGIAAVTHAHDAAFTVAQSKELTGHIPGAHTKNLFLKDKKGQLFLVVAEHERRVDLKRLHEVIGASGRLSFCSAEQMMRHLGVTPGSVTVLALVNDRAGEVGLILDAELMQAAEINCHPLVNTMTTTLQREGLLAFFEATGHVPRLVHLPEPPVSDAPAEAIAG